MVKNRPNSYWEERARKNKLVVIKTENKAIDKLKQVLKTNLDEVQQQIKAFYDKYGDNPAEELSYDEFQKYKRDLLKKAEKYPQDKTLQRIAKQDIPKYRIDRLRQLETELQLQLTEATAYQQGAIKGTLEDVAVIARNTSAKLMKDSTGLLLGSISRKGLNELIMQDWNGKNWSDRIWADREKLSTTLKKTLEKSITQGIGYRKTAYELKKEMGTSFNNAFRIIRTESAHIQGEVNRQSYLQAQEELGLEYYKYDAFLDSRTSTICRELEGKIFKITEMEIGVNAPPMHPNCRSTTQLVLDEGDKQEKKQETVAKKETKDATQKAEEKPILIQKETHKKGSAIPQNKSTKFVKAKTYKEADEYAESLGIKKVEYKGLDLETANRMNKVYAEYTKKYPEIIKNMGYTGSQQNLYKYMKDSIITDEYAAQWLKKHKSEFSDQKINLYVPTVKKELVKTFKPIKNARAVSRTGDFGNIVVFNAKEKYIDTVKNKGKEILNKYKPRGTANIEGSIHHELGHQMDNLLNLRDNKDIQRIYNSMSKQEITDNLSRYSWDNSNKNQYAEFIAEAWSEYNTSRNPRKIAKEVGQIIEKEYKKYKS